MAELTIKIGDQGGDDPARYRDGDVLCAFSNRRIRCTHAQHICHVRAAGFTTDGLRPNDSLAEKMLQRTRQYRFERLDLRTMKRITLATMDEEVLSHTPNAKGEYIHVPEFVERRLAHSHHAMFGSPGREVWYGGRTYYDNDKMNLVWNDIETYSAFREVDHVLWPVGSDDLRVHFFCSCNDMTDAEAEELVAPQVDEKDPENPITEKRRSYKVAWRDLSGLSIGTQDDVTDVAKSVDIRKAVTFDRSLIVSVKPLIAEVG